MVYYHRQQNIDVESSGWYGSLICWPLYLQMYTNAGWNRSSIEKYLVSLETMTVTLSPTWSEWWVEAGGPRNNSNELNGLVWSFKTTWIFPTCRSVFVWEDLELNHMHKVRGQERLHINEMRAPKLPLVTRKTSKKQPRPQVRTVTCK